MDNPCARKYTWAAAAATIIPSPHQDYKTIRDFAFRSKFIDRVAAEIVAKKCQELNPLALLHPELATSKEFTDFLDHLHIVSTKIQKRRARLNPFYARKITKHLRELSLEAEGLVASFYVVVSSTRNGRSS